MGLLGASMMFFITWWIVLLPVLSWGVTTQADHGEISPGTEPSAPRSFPFVRKALVTTGISAALTAAAWAAIEFGLFKFLLPPIE